MSSQGSHFSSSRDQIFNLWWGSNGEAARRQHSGFAAYVCLFSGRIGELGKACPCPPVR